MHIERTGHFRIPQPLSAAMFWVSPEGERTWVEGWDPRYLHDTVFTTDHHHEHTVWIVLRYSASEGVAEYARLTPGSRVGTVTVTGVERDGGTDLQVTYKLTSLTADGERVLAAMTDEAYAAMMREWQALITAAIAR